MSKIKYLGISGNNWAWVKTPVGIFGNSKAFSIISGLMETVFGNYWEVLKNQCEFIGIPRNSQ